jgi:hypothetical protein
MRKHSITTLKALLSKKAEKSNALHRELIKARRELRVLRKVKWRAADQTKSVNVSLSLLDLAENFSQTKPVKAQTRALR